MEVPPVAPPEPPAELPAPATPPAPELVAEVEPAAPLLVVPVEAAVAVPEVVEGDELSSEPQATTIEAEKSIQANLMGETIGGPT
jgi:hypothetical protein